MQKKSSNREGSMQQAPSFFRESHEIISHAPLGIFTSAINGQFLSVNRVLAKMIGYDAPANLVAEVKNIAGLFCGGSGEMERINGLLEKDAELVNHHSRLVKRNGEAVWVALSMRGVKDETGAVICHDGFITEITELKLMEQALSEKSEELERYFLLSMDLFCIANTSGEFMRLNPEWEEVLGYSTAELIGRRFLDFIHPEDFEATVAAIAALEHQQEVRNFENRYRCRDGTYRWLEWRSRPKGNLIYAAARDITDRKKVEEALRESELRYRNFFDNVQETFYITTVEGYVLDVSPSVVHLSKGQYQPDELIGMSLFELYADGDQRKKFLETLQEQNAVVDYELKFKNRDGTIVDCSVSARLQRDKEERPARIIGSLTDITKRKHTERALYESEARFKALHNASFGGIGIHDKGIILECNQGLSDMTGYSINELIGMNGLLLIAEKSRDYVMAKIVSGYEKPYEANGLRKNGEEFPMRLEARNVPYRGKNVRTVEFRDLSEQKQMEKQREKLQLELTQAQKMESVGRLAGGVAHDFNNMLGVILGYTELLIERGREDQSIFPALKGIQQAARRSADLTRQLLAFARKQTVAPEVLDLNKTLQHMLNMLRRLIGEDIELVWQPGENLGEVKIDPSQIDQILANLSVNARDAIKDTGKITIETGNVVIDDAYQAGHLDAIPGEYVMLAVSDNGTGIAKENLPHLFEPFYTTKTMGKGTGLGLATVYGIVKQNNGFINVYSEPGQGTTIKIYFPRHTMADERIAEPDPVIQNISGTETILLVEDEPMILEMAKIMVEEQGYTVLAAATPGQAIDMVHQHLGEIHLLVTDVVMPEMNGRDLVRILLPLLPRLKQLFMSGYTANVIAHHGVLDEGVNFIQKPFAKSDLLVKIREVLDHNSELMKSDK